MEIKKDETSALQGEGCTSQDQRNSIILLADREVTVAAVCRVGTSRCQNQSSFSLR